MSLTVTLTGRGGVGKTTISNNLLSWMRPHMELVVSTTTRSPRSSDLPGEYEYVTRLKFLWYRITGQFLWTTSVTGNWYGTRRRAVDAIVTSSYKIGLMLIVPEIIPILRRYLPKKVYSIYILSPSEEELRERMRVRGDSKENVEKRIAQDLTLDEDALLSKDYDEYIRNDEKDGHAIHASRQAMEKILAIINKQKSAS